MNIAMVILEMEQKLGALKEERRVATAELDKLLIRKKELEDILEKSKPDVDGLELAIEGLKSTSFCNAEKTGAEPAKVETPVDEPVKKDRRGGKKTPVRINMFGPDNSIKKHWNSMNQCTHEMNWTPSRIRSMLSMSREAQLRRYGFYLGFH